MYNVTIRCVHATSFAVETKSIIYSDSLSNPECNGDAPYCHLGPVRFCDIFPHYFPNGTIFEEKLFNVNIFRFSSKNVFWNIFNIFPRQQRQQGIWEQVTILWIRDIAFLVEILCTYWIFEGNNCHADSAVYLHFFSRNKISDFYNLVKVVPRLQTANV